MKNNSRKELQNLVKENRELSKKLELVSGKGASVDGDKGGASVTSSSFGGSTLTVDEAEDGFELVDTLGQNTSPPPLSGDCCLLMASSCGKFGCAMSVYNHCVIVAIAIVLLFEVPVPIHIQQQLHSCTCNHPCCTHNIMFVIV